MNISVSSNIDSVVKDFDQLRAKSIPYAISNAINDVCFALRSTELPDEISRLFDKPVSFTTSQNAWEVIKAKSGQLTGTVKMRPKQSEYMQYQVFGGEELPKKKAIPIPKEDQIAAHGGLKRNWKSAMNNKKSFIGKPKGKANAPSGVWVRLGKQYVKKTKNSGGKHTGAIRLKYAFEDKTHYKVKWDIAKQASGYVSANFDLAFRTRLQEQLDYQLKH